MAYPRNVAEANRMLANGEISLKERNDFVASDKAMKMQGAIGLGAKPRTSGLGANGRTKWENSPR